MPNEKNPFDIIANIQILEGIYKDIWIHLTFKFPENYPIKAPRCRLTPGQEFNQKYHHHLYGESY